MIDLIRNDNHFILSTVLDGVYANELFCYSVHAEVERQF